MDLREFAVNLLQKLSEDPTQALLGGILLSLGWLAGRWRRKDTLSLQVPSNMTGTLIFSNGKVVKEGQKV